jgi:hypothetical protein
MQHLVSLRFSVIIITGPPEFLFLHPSKQVRISKKVLDMAAKIWFNTHISLGAERKLTVVNL